MSRTNEKSPNDCGVQGFGYHTINSQNTAVRVATQENMLAPNCGKSLAMWLYNFGTCDFALTQCVFDRRPDWYHA